MESNVQFEDYSMKVKTAITEKTIQWLYEVATEIVSKAKRYCKMDDESGGKQLKGSYRYAVDEAKGEAQIGSPLESAFWEEWGTGEYAAHGDGRKGWWVYIKYGPKRRKMSKSYATKAEAEEAAEFLRRVKKLDAYATNGREPNYTLEKAFTDTRPFAERRLAELLGEDGGQ